MREGDIVAARYRIKRRAGAGGMGTVYEAVDLREHTAIALKMWRAAPDTEPRAHSRVVREASALTEVHHPAVVRYVDHGTTPEHGPFLAMAWVPGETLAERLEGPGLSPSEGLRLVARLSSGLAAMHAAGVVHRDLKPSNVMLASGSVEEAVIVDFGVARVASVAESTEGPSGHLGTARYMAPEQIRNARTVDGRADVFALGCILFEALTGRPAFEGLDPVTVLARILFEPLPVPSARRAELPDALDQLVLTMLARDLDRRPSAPLLMTLVHSIEGGESGREIAKLARTPVDVTRSGSSLEMTSEAASSRTFGRLPSLRGAAASFAIPRTRSVPALHGRLLGRDEDCEHLSALLCAGSRVITVWGGPGVGKTRLVREAVRRASGSASQAWDAILLADFADARDADDMVRTVAREAGVALESSGAPEVALGRALGKMGRVLLVADPVDQVAAPLAAAILAWSYAAPGLQVLAVSRRRFRPPGAVAIEIAPLSLTPEGEGGLSPAATLLLERAREAAPSSPVLTPGRESADRAERLAQALDGIPLAIELYASRVAVLGWDAILERAPGKSSSDMTLDSSEGAMSNAIAWSWQQLDPAEQSAFMQCAVFRGGFTVDAASAVIRTDEVSAPASDLIQSLRDRSLLLSWSVDAPDEARFSMLASVREYAWQVLARSPDLGDTLRRHASHYARYFTAGQSRGARSAHLHDLSLLEREAENLFAAAEFSLSDEEADAGDGMKALVALEPAMVARGALSSYRGLLDRAVEAASKADTPRSVQILGGHVRQIRARLEAPRGGIARASADLALCRSEALREADRSWEGSILLDLGVVHHLHRDLASARQCYEAARARLDVATDPRGVGRCLGNIGAVLHDEGNLAEAARSYREAIALFERTGEVRQRANFVGNLAVLEQELGHSAVARDLYERSVALLEPVGDARLLAITLGNFGVLELEGACPEAALALFERCLALLAGSGDRRSEALCLGRIGSALASLDRIEEAEAAIAEGERRAPPGDALVVSAVTLQRSFVELALGRAAKASGDLFLTEQRVTDVERRIDQVSRAQSDARPLADQSDDIRAILRMIEPVLAALRR